MAQKLGYMPSVLDREISSASDDAFGHRHYAKALESLIESETNQPPFSIGLLGPWGTGKSSIKEIYLSSLAGDQSKENGLRRRDRIHTITFNAWRYGNEDIKRALLRHVFLELDGDEEALRQNLFGELRRTLLERKSWREWWREVVDRLGSPIVFLTLVVFIVVLAAIALLYFSGIDTAASKAVVISSVVLAVVFLAKYVVDIKLKPVSLYNAVTAVQLPSTTAEQYEDLLIAQLNQFNSGSKGRRCERLVVFVDDLDRLSASEMVAGLDAVRTFLEMPHHSLPSGLGIIFVISCDEDRVAQALARGRGRMGVEELPGSVFNRTDARRYLDRLFQFRLEVVRFPKRDMRNYATQKLTQFGTLQSDLEKRGVRIQNLIDRLIHVGVQSPRNALQILNAFVQSWWLAVERERDGLGSDEAGVLHQGAVTSHPLSLAAICVLRVDFPDFFDYLQERPDLIQVFSGIVFGTASADEQPPRVQEILSGFLETDKEGKVSNRVRAQHRPLRLYLSSLQQLRWPRSIQPLVLLAEDSVTRQFGSDKAAELRDSFVSGDLQGVLEVFGRANDTKPLRPENIRLLEDMAESVSQDTKSRQINAARVLAQLPTRIPEEKARGLMTPLARQMTEFKEVRMNIGPRTAQQVLKSVNPSDRQDVAARFIQDLLKLDVEPEFLLPSGEEANLEEMTQLTRDACDLALWVRSDHGLPDAADGELLEWLKVRTVRAAGNPTTLQFTELESWMKEHEDHLLKDLNSEYSHLAVAQFEADDVEGFDNLAALDRISKVFKSLAEAGEESRRILWAQLVRLVAVKGKEACARAWDEAIRYADTPTETERSGFVREMSRRVDRDKTDQGNWPLDWESAGQTLLDLVTRWGKVLDEEALQAFSELVAHWGEKEETAEFAERGYKLIREGRPQLLSSICSAWTSKKLGDLPWKPRKILADDFLGNLNEEHRESIGSELDRVIGQDKVDDKVAADYVRFVKEIPDDAWEEEPLRLHLDRLFTRIVERFQNQNGYLQQFFPAARRLIPVAPPGRTATMLQPLFSQAAGLPEVYPMLHGQMVEEWPEENEQTGSYGAQQIFERANQFIEQQSSVKNASDVIRSMANLVVSGRVGKSNLDSVAEAVCRVWPHSPDVLPDCLKYVVDNLNPDRIVELIKQTDQAGEQAVGLLKTALPEIVASLDSGQRQNTLMHLLNEQPILLEEEPDGGLRIWIDAQESEQSSVLEAALTNEELNDKQIERLFQQSIRIAERLHLEFFIKVLPSLFSRSELKRTREKIFESEDSITALVSKADQRANLALALIEALPDVAEQETLARLAEWIRDSDGQAALEQAEEVLQKLDTESLEILVKKIPDSRRLKRELDSRESSSSGEEVANG